MSEIKCFFMEQTLQVRRALRRYAMDKPCESNPLKIHDASTPLDVIENPPDHNGITRAVPCEIDPHDTLWPEQCSSCDYRFDDTDVRQVFQQRLYRRSDNNALMTINEAPPGAMWDAAWYPNKGPDGKCLVVMTPAGEWMVDAPSTSGQPWTRTGEVPYITASPSIWINNRSCPEYHGFLINGVLKSV